MSQPTIPSQQPDPTQQVPVLPAPQVAAQAVQPTAPVQQTPVKESGHARMIRGLKGLGVAAGVLVVAVILMVWIGSNGYTGKGAISSVVLFLIGGFMLIKSLVLTIWGALVRSREQKADGFRTV